MASESTAAPVICFKCGEGIDTSKSFIYDDGKPHHINCVDWQAAMRESDAARRAKEKANDT